MGGNRAWALLCLSWCVVGCESDLSLFIDLKTDLTPSIEFTSVRTLVDGQSISVVVDGSASYLEGVRVAEVGELEAGTRVVSIRLERDGVLVAERDVSIDLTSDLGVTVLITRDCQGVACPGPMDDPSYAGCLGAVCVAPDCFEENPERCPPPECASAADCTTPSPCAIPSCTSGVCTFTGDDSMCPAGLFCAGELGCRVVDGGCTFGPWGEPYALENVQSPDNDWGPYLSPDRRELFFGSNRATGTGDYDIYQAERASADEPFGPPVLVPELSTPSEDDNPYLTDDGLTIFYNSGPVIYRATRGARGSPFGSIVAIDLGGDAVAPSLSRDESVLYFSGNRATGLGDLDLYRAPRSGAGFGPVELLASLSTIEFDCCAAEAWDGSLLFTGKAASVDRVHRAFRDGAGGFGARDVFAAIEIPGVDPHPTPDGLAIVFSSPMGLDGWDVYLIERACIP